MLRRRRRRRRRIPETFDFSGQFVSFFGEDRKTRPERRNFGFEVCLGLASLSSPVRVSVGVVDVRRRRRRSKFGLVLLVETDQL